MADNVNYEVDEQEAMDEIEPEIELLDQDFIEDEEPEAPEEDVKTAAEAAVEKRAAELRERLEGSEQSTASAMGEVVETLKSLRQEPQTKQSEEAIEDLETLEKRLSSGFYDNPMEAVKQYSSAMLKKYERETLQPVIQQMGQVLRDTAKTTSKQTATDDTSKFIIEKYSDEVEKLVDGGQIRIGPNAYKEAISRVAADHMDELIDWKMEQRASRDNEAEQEEATAKPGRNASPGKGNAAPRPDSKVQVSRAARDEIYKRADAKRIDRSQYMDWFVRTKKEELRKLNRRA